MLALLLATCSNRPDLALKTDELNNTLIHLACKNLLGRQQNHIIRYDRFSGSTLLICRITERDLM
jgi:hypothetical protein